jgi:hypothetical protein
MSTITPDITPTSRLNHVPPLDVSLKAPSSVDELAEANKKLNPHLQGVPGFVKLAVEFGYIIPGWEFLDYCRAAVQGMPHAKVKGAGFQNIVIWGMQGTYKSNLAMQFAYAIYQDWDVVLKRILLTKQDAIRIYDQTKEMGKRIPMVILDDITTVFPKQLWFESRQLFTLLQQFIATIRMRFSNIISTTPLPQNLVSSLADNLTFEIFNTPVNRYLVERYVWLPDPARPATSNLRKIVVEYTEFDPKQVPSDVWKEYEERRWQVTDEIVSKMRIQIDPEHDGKDIKEIMRNAILAVNSNEVIELFRAQGRKIDTDKARELISLYKELCLQRLDGSKGTAAAQKILTY